MTLAAAHPRQVPFVVPTTRGTSSPMPTSDP